MSELALDILSKKYIELEKELEEIKKKTVYVRPLHDLPYVGNGLWKEDSRKFFGLLKIERHNGGHISHIKIDDALMTGRIMNLGKQCYLISREQIDLLRRLHHNPRMICRKEDEETLELFCEYRGWIDIETCAYRAVWHEFDNFYEGKGEHNE